MFLENDSSRNLVLTIFAIIVTIVIIILLIRTIKKQEKKLNEENEILVDTMITKSQIREYVNTYASKVGAFGSFALFLVSLDDYDSIKEILGDEPTNNIVKGVAERLVHLFKGAANIAQFDEKTFLIFDKKEYSYDELEETAESLLDLVNDNGSYSRKENVQITASIGIAIYPTCGVSFKELYSNLELAAYIANRQGGNKYIIYYNELKDEESGNLEYFNEVRNAMDRGELTLFYQPIIDLKVNAIYGFEALIRWNHPEHGIISPDKFIPILEQSGDIKYLAKWTLENVIKTSQELNKVYPNRDFKFTINLSVKQMMEESMSDDFKKVCKKYNFNPTNIVLEVAQYAMFEKMNAVRINLLRLRDQGFLIATDGLGLDFGSISQLETKPIDVLKLDRAFLNDINDNQMQERYVQMLVESANKTNRLIISEGVENSDMLQYVKKNNIEYAQGYLFSKPFPGQDLADFIHIESWKNIKTDTNEAEIEQEIIDNNKDMA